MEIVSNVFLSFTLYLTDILIIRKKGKFRPTLKKLIAQNDDQDVESITREGFNILIEAKDTKPSKDEYKKLIKKSMTTLVKLRGVGPATASLLLSTLNKVTNLAPPFYSDEAAEYIFSQNGESETKLKYSMSEYIKWLDLMWEFNEDYQFDYTDLENGIWTLKKNEYYEIKPQKADDINGPSGDDNKQEDDHDIIKSRKKRKVAK